MEGLILGIDLCDDYSQISCYNTDRGEAESVNTSGNTSNQRIPTVVCKKRGADEWQIGEEAYRTALFGAGTMVDRLLKLARRGGTATIEGTKYRAPDLLTRYLHKLIGVARHNYGIERVDSLVITVHDMDGQFNDMLVAAAESAGIDRASVHIFSHTEAYVYYVMSQQSDIWANAACLFDLREDGLFYYEMRVIRGRRPQVIEATHEKLEDGFSLDVLDTPSGERLGDAILSACAQRLLSKKIMNSVFLTGKGFNTTDWAPEFLKVVCSRRRVFASAQLFSHGAAIAAYDLTQETGSYPYLLSCEGRISSTLSVYAVYGGRREQIVLASAGTNWYEARASVDFILDDVDALELIVAPVGSARVEKVNLSLDELPARPNKTTRIELILSFISEKCMTVRVIDRGFGELFPGTGTVIRQDYMIP